MERTPTRRTVLTTTGAALAATLAGCTQSDGTASSDASTETSATTGAATEEATRTTTAPETATPEPSDVSFSNSAGGTVEATRYGAGDCGVVLVPQINMDRESWVEQATRLAEQGLVALAIDEGENRAASVRAAIDFLRVEHGVTNVVLVGASTGGEAVVAAAASDDTEVAGLVTLSAAGGTSHATALPGRKLFVVSENDDQRFVDVARTLQERASSPKTLVQYAGKAHGQRLFESAHGQALWNDVLALVEQACQN